MSPIKHISRRSLLASGTAGTAVIGYNIVSTTIKRKKYAYPDKEQLPPSERLNIGFVGVGGRGRANIKGCMHHNVYALCDVDAERGAAALYHFKRAKRFNDWRVFLEKEAKNLDAVVITTPDHNHAVITMAAMQLGLPVYTEKPLTRTISEARILTEYARKNKIITQMGNFGHATEGARLTNEWIQGGLLGDVREVHCWTDRAAGWWPQGIVRPAAKRVPSTMNWDVWLGPAPGKPYNGSIAPFNWRGYWDYGAGALGDMGAHIMDHPVWALGLGAPLSVEVEFKRKNPASSKDTYPVSSVVTYQFAARGEQSPVTMKWFDGENRPPRPDGMEENRTMPVSGVAYYGSKNSMMHESHGGVPRIFPEKDMQAAVSNKSLPPKTIPRSPGHYEEWLQAIKANDPSMTQSNFNYAGPLTEMMLLGCVATRVGSGTKLTWNATTMKADNDIANHYVEHECRKGWSL